jgi:tetratricopeptide (TPR) repeat protein
MRRAGRVHLGAWLGSAIVGFVLARGEPAAGRRMTNFSEEEWQALPRVCLAQRFISEEFDNPLVPAPERTQVSGQLGPSFLHYHHYCWALLWRRRGDVPSREQRFQYHEAVDNLNYVIRNADPSFALMPDVYAEKGDVLVLLGERDAASKEYENALRARADYTRASAALVQLYLDAGQLEAARTALEEGLKHAPDSALLAEKKAALAKREAEKQ